VECHGASTPGRLDLDNELIECTVSTPWRRLGDNEGVRPNWSGVYGAIDESGGFIAWLQAIDNPSPLRIFRIQERLLESRSNSRIAWAFDTSYTLTTPRRRVAAPHGRRARPSRTSRRAPHIEDFYNVERIHSTLDDVSPIEFELKMPMSTIAA
jgi:hypothetical protein